MNHLAARPKEPRLELFGVALAASLPLAVYLSSASLYGYWLDSGEFVAAAADLDIVHPPGHPLAALVGALFAQLPVGTIAYRVALASALCAAAACGFLFLATLRTLRSLTSLSDRLLIPLSTGGVWLVAGSTGWWLQAVRPEVYALHALLACIILERLTAFETSWPARELPPLYIAAFVFGLALTNHHFLALLLLPAVAPTLLRTQRTLGFSALLPAALATLCGLLGYLYLPLRALAGPPLNLGDPDSLGRFFWVVSAQTFQKNTGSGVPQPLLERFADVLVTLGEGFHLIPLALAAIGAYAMLRMPGPRRLGVLWLALFTTHIAARTWLGFVRSNPDALGYLMPAFAAVGVFAAAGVVVIVDAMEPARHRAAQWAAYAACALVVGLGVAQIYRNERHASLAHYSASDAFEEVGWRHLPEKAVVILHDPQSIFLHWGTQSQERNRPDITLIPLPLLSYPHMAEHIVAAHPELRSLVGSTLLHGRITAEDLQSLTRSRPVYVDLDPRLSDDARTTLLPEGRLYRVMPARVTREEVGVASISHDHIVERLYELLGSDAETDHETRNRLLWQHYMDALYFAQAGQLKAALRAADHGLKIQSQARELRALRDGLLSAPPNTPLDVSPFLLPR